MPRLVSLFLLVLVALIIGSGSGQPAQAGGGAPFTTLPVPVFKATQEIEVTLPSEQDWIVGYGQTVTEYFQNGGQGATNSNYLWAFHGGEHPYRRFVVTNGVIMGPYKGHPEDAFCSLLAQIKVVNGKGPGVSSGIYPTACETSVTPTLPIIDRVESSDPGQPPLRGGSNLLVGGQNLFVESDREVAATFRLGTTQRVVTTTNLLGFVQEQAVVVRLPQDIQSGTWQVSIRGSNSLPVEILGANTPTPTPSLVPSLEKVELAGPFGPTYQLRIYGKNLDQNGVYVKAHSQLGEDLSLVPDYVWPAQDPDLATVLLPRRLPGNWEISVKTVYGESNKIIIAVSGLQLLFPIAARR